MEKRDYLFIYENVNNIPNGDPLTGEQRFDDALGKIEVSDLRIKRFIRDYIIENFKDNLIFSQFDVVEAKKLLDKFKVEKTKDKTKKNAQPEEIWNKEAGKTGSAFSFRKMLLEKGLIQKIDQDLDKVFLSKNNIHELLLGFVDVRMFGSILTESGQNANVQGAIQFKNMNPSMHKCERKYVQNTVCLPSNVITNEQGSFGMNTLIPYSLIQVYGKLCDKGAEKNNLSEKDITLMKYSMWQGVEVHSRSKNGATPLLLLEVVYKEMSCPIDEDVVVYKKIRNIDNKIKLTTSIEEEDIRKYTDFELNFDDLIQEINKNNVKYVKFYTENEILKAYFENIDKFVWMEEIDINNVK
jgi:CRISPR-associated protein Csh2